LQPIHIEPPPISGFGSQFSLEQLKEALTEVVSSAISKQTEELKSNQAAIL
jgi:hypothetical protein